MKSKDFNKKLSLNKETVVVLGKSEMINVKGGSSNICWAIGGYLGGKLIDALVDAYTEDNSHGDCTGWADTTYMSA